MVMPGVTIRKVSEKRASFGLACLLSVPGDQHGHDNGLAGTGRHLECRARQTGVRGVVRFTYRVLDPGVAVFPCHLGDVDRSFKGFILAEEQFFLAAGIGPIGDQAGGGRRDADIAARAPQSDASPDIVNKLVFFDPVLRPFGIELKLLGPLLLWSGDGNEIRADTAAVNLLVRYSLVGKPEMAGRLDEW